MAEPSAPGQYESFFAWADRVTDDEYAQSRTACCPRQTIPDSCSCPEGCACSCLDCDCGTIDLEEQ